MGNVLAMYKTMASLAFENDSLKHILKCEREVMKAMQTELHSLREELEEFKQDVEYIKHAEDDYDAKKFE